MGSFEKKDDLNDSDSNFRQEIHSKVIRAGRRTYFFDVKSTRNEEFYLTITESKRIIEGDGNFHYEKHKIFLYREDFEKFLDCLNDIMDYIKSKQPEESFEKSDEKEAAVPEKFDEVEFGDLNS